jgi:hypothetical protein
MRGPNRRSVLGAAVVMAGAATAPAAVAKAAAGPPSLTLFDPAEPAARAFAAARGGERLAIEGDRIRLARRLFARDAPARLTVVGRHADLILLAEAAWEHGYRPVSSGPFPAMDGREGMFILTAERRL